jgi:hypothetical protein
MRVFHCGVACEGVHYSIGSDSFFSHRSLQVIVPLR